MSKVSQEKMDKYSAKVERDLQSDLNVSVDAAFDKLDVTANRIADELVVVREQRDKLLAAAKHYMDMIANGAQFNSAIERFAGNKLREAILLSEKGS